MEIIDPAGDAAEALMRHLNPFLTEAVTEALRVRPPEWPLTGPPGGPWSN